ncbi:MAG: HEAT repeat domain-containing protein [Aquimonas sp.]|nr:HEAT repeat domain-containing protein [Aquimonas sp.]
MLGLGCLDDVLDRVVDGETTALELIVYFEPNAAARHALQRLLDESDVRQHPALLPVLTRLGSSTVDAILSAGECIDDCHPFNNFLFAFVLESLGSDRRRAALPLAQKLGQHRGTSEEELGLVRMLEALGQDIAPAEAELLTLFHSTPDLKERLLGLLVQAGSPEAIALLKVQLRAPWPRTRDFAHAAIAGQRARALTPVLLEVAASSTPEANRAALLALGHVAGPEDAAMVQAVLHPWMRDGSHPIRALFTAMALGELASPASESVLLEAADLYWYPPVRVAAQEALDRMRSASDSGARIDVQRFFDRVSVVPGPVECEAIALRMVDQPQGEKLYKGTHTAQLQKLSYRGDLVERYLPPPPPPPPGVNPDWRPSWQPVEVPEHTPDLALRVAGGWLLGANRGEWGGELIFAGDNGRRQGVLGRNVEDIYRLGSQTIALVGVAHMTINDGVVYRLRQAGNGEWRAESWLQLPGTPYSSWPVHTGEILVNTHGGGTILIAADGRMRMAPCPDPPALEFFEQR